MSVTWWHQLADAIQGSNLTAADKSVFRYLLDKADYKTAELPARFTPTQASIGRRTSHSVRQVKYSVGHLRKHKWLTAKGATGPGKPLEYSFRLGSGCDCTGRRHAPERVQPESPTGATFGYRTGATNGCNAAGQMPSSTERQREEGEERLSAGTGFNWESQRRREEKAAAGWKNWPAGSEGERPSR